MWIYVVGIIFFSSFFFFIPFGAHVKELHWYVLSHSSRHCSIVVNEYLNEHDVKPQPEISAFIEPTCDVPLGQLNAAKLKSQKNNLQRKW